MFAAFANVDFQRTRFWCLAAAIAIDVPRRLGPDADYRELAIDKRISRKVCHNYEVLWELFHKEVQAPPAPVWTDRSLLHQDPVMVRIGSTVIWPRQIDYLIDVVLRRMTKLTEYEHLARIDRMSKWYNKQGMFLEWELEALHRIKNFIAKTQQTDYKVSAHTTSARALRRSQ